MCVGGARRRRPARRWSVHLLWRRPGGSPVTDSHRPVYAITISIDGFSSVVSRRSVCVWVARRLRQADPHGPDLEIACESDSMVSVLAQRSSKTRSPIMNWVHRELVLREIKWRVCLKLVHLPGVKNGLADGLSRDYVDVVAKFDPRRRLNVDFTRFWWQSMPSYLEKSLGLVTTGTVFEQNIM